MKNLLKVVLSTIFVLIITLSQPALAADTANGDQVFSAQCAGCHIKGGNIIRWGKNLHMKALKKYGMDSVDAIASIVTNGKNNMSAYKDRLSEQEIQNVSAYVLEQAVSDWR